MSAAQIGRAAEPEVPVIGYCVHCRSRRPMHGAIQVCNRRGGRDLKGHCAVCGKAMYRLGGWDSVMAAAAQEAKAAAANHPLSTPHKAAPPEES